jgi:hypothetical protein
LHLSILKNKIVIKNEIRVRGVNRGEVSFAVLNPITTSLKGVVSISTISIVL